MSGARNAWQRFADELDYAVFGTGFAVTALAVIAFTFRDEAARRRMGNVNEFLQTNLGWAYLLAMFVLVGFVGFLIFGPWGNITLGKDDEEPAFSFPAYFAMLYSAGIAAGVVFWGPAEAVSHYGDDVSPFVGAGTGTPEAAVGAVQYTFFHWGVSAWTAYVVLGIPIAYYGYRYDAPLRISTILVP